MMRYLFTMIILFVGMTVSTYAASKLQPRDLTCHLKNIYLKGSVYYLNKTAPTTSQVYLIKNAARHPILIDHVKKNAGAGAGWSSLVAPNHWSAIAVSEKDFNLQCKIISKGVAYEASCAFLKICQPKHKLKKKFTGSYWIIENADWPRLVKKLK